MSEVSNLKKRKGKNILVMDDSNNGGLRTEGEGWREDSEEQ